jgi:hypothetical protein
MEPERNTFPTEYLIKVVPARALTCAGALRPFSSAISGISSLIASRSVPRAKQLRGADFAMLVQSEDQLKALNVELQAIEGVLIVL